MLRPAAARRRPTSPAAKLSNPASRYHVMFAPQSQYRAAVTPAQRSRGATTPPVSGADPTKLSTPRHVAMSWARRLKRCHTLKRIALPLDPSHTKLAVQTALTRSQPMTHRQSGRAHGYVRWLCLIAGAAGGLGCLAPPGIADAQAVHDEALGKRNYDIAGAELGIVLIRFAEQAGVQLSVDVALTRGKHSPGIKGEYTLEQALRKILDDNGLVFRMAGPHTIVIDKLPDVGPG